MKVIKTVHKFCHSCMEEHDVQLVEVSEREVFKDVEVDFTSIYDYCPETDELSETEEQLKANTLAIKDAYRNAVGLLTSTEIRNIRERYEISQKDFSEILEWGGATITRYENHQVQNRANDDILRKIASDPEWFLELLEGAKDRLSKKAYAKYLQNIRLAFSNSGNLYIIKAIQAAYAGINDPIFSGNTELDLSKVVQVVNYLAKEVQTLHTVKLMKLLWYVDMLHFKRYGHSMTGQVYCAFQMGALPLCHDQIIVLDGIKSEEVFYGEYSGMKFNYNPQVPLDIFSSEETTTLNAIIDKLGRMSREEIVEYMHEEDAYKLTPTRTPISYQHAAKLTIN